MSTIDRARKKPGSAIARPYIPVRHGDVGALFLLWDAGLLVLYLAKYLLLSGHVDTCCSIRRLSPSMRRFQGMRFRAQPLSSLIYGTYTGLIYATPWLGGWIADNVLGQRKTAMIGIVAMAFGHFMMGVGGAFVPALTLLIFGGGFFKTNTSAQVGML